MAGGIPSMTQLRKFRFSAIQGCVWNHIHNGHLVLSWMSEPQLFHFWLSNVFSSSMAKAYVQCMSERPQNGLLWSVKFKVNRVSAWMTSPYLKICADFSIISLFNCKSFNRPKHAPWCQGDLAACPGSRSCSFVLGLLSICLDIYVGGKLIRYCKQAQKYINGETLYRPYILSLIPHCHTSIVHVLLAIDLKQAVFSTDMLQLLISSIHLSPTGFHSLK